MTRTATAATLAAATALALLGDMFMYAVLPSRPAAAGITAASLGVVLSVHRLIRLAVNPVSGLLYDRLGRRRPFLAGMTLAVCATTGYLLAPGLAALVGARLVWGLAYSLVSVGSLAIVLDVSTPADRGSTAGIFQSLVSVGTLGALLLAGVLADLAGYRPALAILAALTALGLLLAAARIRETAPERAGSARGSTWTEGLALFGAYRHLDRRLLGPMLVSFGVFLSGNGVLMSTLGMHLRTLLTAGRDRPALPLASLTGTLLAARKLWMMAASPMAGRLADGRPGRRGTVALGLALGVAGFATLAQVESLWGTIIGLSLTAAGEGLATPALTAWTGDLTPADRRGLVMGGLATANDLGGTLGPLLGYAIATGSGLAPAYVVCAVAGLAGLGVLALADPSPRARSSV